MSSKSQNRGGRFLSSIKSSLSNIGSPIHKSVNGHEGLEVINPEGGTTEDVAAEANKGRLKQEARDSFWKILPKNIGADIMSLGSFPISVCEPMSDLQKIAERMEYSHLLDQADECEDPYMQLVYAISWAVSFLPAFQRTWKPFSPLLGETYEMVNHGGFTFIAEEMSHHPSVAAAHVENEHFTCDMTSMLKTKLLGNSIDIYPIGRTCVTLKRDGVVLDFVRPPAKANNIIFGRTWISSWGDTTMTNKTTGDKVVLKFQPNGWFGAACYDVSGYVYNAAKEPKILMSGKWNKTMSYQPCDVEGKPLPGTELKEVWRVADVPANDKFQYTYFAHKIISFNTAPRKLLASDSRLRPDRYALEKGDLSKAGSENRSLEERQRNEKKKREAKGDQFTPRWFNRTGEVTTTPWGEVDVYAYNGNYNEHRAAVDSSNSVDEVDIQLTEFNPCQ